jgi:hypothetical protein
MTLPALNAAALIASGGDPLVTKCLCSSAKRMALDHDGMIGISYAVPRKEKRPEGFSLDYSE